MKNPTRSRIRMIAAACLLLGGTAAHAQTTQEPSHPIQKEMPMTRHAHGPFDVKLAAQKPDNPQAESAGLGRMSIDKQFHGDLEATSKGEMLSAMTSTQGSAGYVAIERVSGALHGRSGSFVLQHNATMTRGEPHLNIIVVQDSGTGQLAGLTGTMKITIAEGGKHAYEFEYMLPTVVQ